MKCLRYAMLLLLLVSAPLPLRGEEGSARSVTYGPKGWEFATEDGRFLLHLQSRLQFRYYCPFDSDPVTYDDFDRDDDSAFKVNRARLKVGGHGFEPWLGFYWEYELASANLLDFKFMVSRFGRLSLKVGQWKVDYNRERMISSGRQQMADRSIVNRPFTIDRQQGLALYGRLDPGGADLSYWLGVFTGTGRGSGGNDDSHMMYAGRLEWNFMGRVLALQGSDTGFSEQAAGVVALGAVTNRSAYTRFSQEGGGSLPGYEDGAPGQYRVNQCMVETAFMFRGFSWQQEFHWKEIKDMETCEVTALVGNYAQAGYFFHYLWESVPRPLEAAFRHAFYRPDTGVSRNAAQEFSLAANWFFKGHLNKVTAEVSYFLFPEKAGEDVDGFRFRLQWDVSI